ncbi:MAG: glycosyltransferase [Microthrixaceae bacterium]
MAIVSGLLVERDAISNAVLIEREVLKANGHEVTVHCQGTTFGNLPWVHTGADPWALSQRDGFRDADLVILHFGTAYELFDVLLLSAPPGARRVVRFHNVTPPDLLSGVHRRRAQQGLDQVVISEVADHIWCDSQFNRDVLHDLGISPANTSVLGLCVPELDGLLKLDPTPFEEPPKVLYVGRLVQAKGVLDLLVAFGSSGLAAAGVELHLAGNAALSEPAVLAEVRAVVERRGSGVVMHESPDDSELAALYEGSSVFVMPSYHEGFCVPVIEAMAHGLIVVASDAGALPETVGDDGSLITVGDIEMLRSALLEALGSVRVGVERIRPVRVAEFSYRRFEVVFTEALGAVMGTTA